MKIGTDGILLGAWANCKNKINGLDIGCGTGVIAVMICQKNPEIKMTALDISKDAVKDATINFNNCKWHNNLTLYHQALKEHVALGKYDLIVSNPPFYNDGFKPKNIERSMAKHEDSLSYKEIIYFAEKNLTEKGTLNLIIPFKQEKECINFAKKSNLHLSREYIVYPKADKAANRTLLEFTYNKIETERGELIIENEHRHQYSEYYKNLTRDFYTIFD